LHSRIGSHIILQPAAPVRIKLRTDTPTRITLLVILDVTERFTTKRRSMRSTDHMVRTFINTDNEDTTEVMTHPAK
jgi:hypothetical protein